ncbi:hypothetical protein FGG78_37280 [Thioclava sp. BHET1]|nr:hypothetical protein FGG78_37280 [Thioclava sp. BHET1]
MSRGTAAAQAALAERVEQGFRHILLDLSDDADLAMSRSLANGARAVVASDPLIVAFALDRASGHVSDPAPPRHADGPAALFVGSVGPVARGQLTSFEAEHPVLYLDLLDPRAEETLIDEAVAWALPRIGTRPFGITTWANARQIARIQSSLGRLGAARKAERLLAGIAGRCHGAGVRRFLVAGGETAGAIVGALGLSEVRALPLGPLRGGLCVAEGPDPVSLYLKSGKLGAPDVFLQALELMSNQEVS